MPARPRDLVFVSAGLELDGGGRALAGRLLADSCARFARERGVGFELLTLGRDGAPSAERGLGCRVRSFPGRQRALAVELWRRQLSGRRQALVFDLLGPARAQAWVPPPRRSPYLVPLYGIEVWRPLAWDRRRTLAGAAARFAISAHTLERARPFCPELRDDPVVPLALEDREPAGEPDATLLGRLGEGFFLIVGRMSRTERYKGHDPLLEALPRVLRQRPEARLVVAGGGDDRERLEAKAAALGLAERAVFTGFVEEATLAELYRRCSAFVMPSRDEGFGLVYLEAMRAGKPVVAARGSAAEEVVADPQTGLLVDPNDPAELAAALAGLLADPERARRLGEAGRRRGREEFGIERFRARVKPLLERLCAA